MSVTAKEIDWNEVWKKQMLRNIECRGGLDCTEYWQTRDEAQRYTAIVKKDDWKKAREVLADIELKPGARVLDIGAGPGTFTVPMAQQVGHVTAVEPAETMRWCLEDNLREAGLANVSIVPRRWEDVDVDQDLDPPYDLVIASYSLGMLDLQSAVVKMSQVASGPVYLLWFAEASGRNHGLWNKVFEKPYRPKPQADVIFNVLYGLEYKVNLRLQETKSRKYYPDQEQAYNEYMADFQIKDERSRVALEGALPDILQRDETGLFIESQNRSARIWWEP